MHAKDTKKNPSEWQMKLLAISLVSLPVTWEYIYCYHKYRDVCVLRPVKYFLFVPRQLWYLGLHMQVFRGLARAGWEDVGAWSLTEREEKKPINLNNV